MTPVLASGAIAFYATCVVFGWEEAPGPVQTYFVETKICTAQAECTTTGRHVLDARAEACVEVTETVSMRVRAENVSLEESQGDWSEWSTAYPRMADTDLNDDEVTGVPDFGLFTAGMGFGGCFRAGLIFGEPCEQVAEHPYGAEWRPVCTLYMEHLAPLHYSCLNQATDPCTIPLPDCDATLILVPGRP